MRGGWPADYAATDMLAAVQVIVLVYPTPFVTKVLLDALLLHWPGECGARERRYERGFQVFYFLLGVCGLAETSCTSLTVTYPVSRYALQTSS